MKEIRDIKIDIITGNQNQILNLFNKITKDIKIINCNVYNECGLEFIYFVPKSNKDYEWIFYQDVKNDRFWCNYTTYWSIFEKLGLNYLEIQSITKYLVEEKINQDISYPLYEIVRTNHIVDDTLKQELSKPIIVSSPAYRYNCSVEEALNKKLVKPIPKFNQKRGVEEDILIHSLKREVNKPLACNGHPSIGVEQALKRETGNE